MRPLSQRVEWLEDELEPRKAGGLLDYITTNVTAINPPKPLHPTQVAALALAQAGYQRPVVNSARQSGKTAALSAALAGGTLVPGRPPNGPPSSTLRQSAPAWTVVTGWHVPIFGTAIHRTYGMVTVVKVRWDGLLEGDILRCARTGENMAVVHAAPGVLYVTRGIGSIAPKVLKAGDQLDFIAMSGASKWGAIAPAQYNYTSIQITTRWASKGSNSLPGLGAEGEIELAIEPVLAFRVFKVDVDDLFEIALRSVSFDTLWPRQEELVATCRHDQPHEAPAAECSCGIYLTKTIAKSMEQASGPLVVLAVVRGWGRVVKHETGWRVQKAYPVGLAVLPPMDARPRKGGRGQAAADKLRDAYAVPTTVLTKSPLDSWTPEAFAIEQGWLGGE